MNTNSETSQLTLVNRGRELLDSGRGEQRHHRSERGEEGGDSDLLGVCQSGNPLNPDQHSCLLVPLGQERLKERETLPFGGRGEAPRLGER